MTTFSELAKRLEPFRDLSSDDEALMRGTAKNIVDTAAREALAQWNEHAERGTAGFDMRFATFFELANYLTYSFPDLFPYRDWDPCYSASVTARDLVSYLEQLAVLACDVPLNERQKRILTVLQSAQGAMTVDGTGPTIVSSINITFGHKYDVKDLRADVRLLEVMGLVIRPSGPKGGAEVTRNGLTYLNDHPLDAPVTP